MNMQSSISSAGNRVAGVDSIVTNYDRILDLVRLNQNMKLDDLTRAMQMDEERVAEELQTLEDNGLIEIRYPAFGEPIVHYKG
jgi:predicted ArsR family transcriptional regulator